MALLILSPGGLAAAEPPGWFGDSVVAADAAAFVSMANPKEVRRAWDITLLGELWVLDALQPFADEFGAKITAQLKDHGGTTGLAWDDIESIAGGGVTFVIAPRLNGTAAQLVLVDTAGKEERATALVNELLAYHRDRGAKVVQEALDDATLSVVVLPRKAGDNGPDMVHVFATRGALFMGCDDTSVARGLLATGGDATSRLSADTVYQRATAMLAERAPPGAPATRWYANTMALAAMADADVVAARGRAARDRQASDERKADHVAFLKRHGFDTIEGIAGDGVLAAGQLDIVVRSAIATRGGQEGAMRFFSFVTGETPSPPEWLPADLGTCATVEVDVAKSFDGFATLFDEFVGEGETGVFDEVVASIHDDPNGPMVDVRAEMLAQLAHRVTFVGDSRVDGEKAIERSAMLIPASDPASMAECLERLMTGDPQVLRHDFGEVAVWEMKPEAADSTERLSSTIMTVARGHLIVASHVDFVEKLVTEGQPLLKDDAEYRRVLAEMDQRGGATAVVRVFARSEQDLRASYEMARLDRLDSRDLVIGQLLHELERQRGEPLSLGDEKIDGGLLPEFDEVKPYLAPIGIQAWTLDGGAFVEGFTLRKL